MRPPPPPPRPQQRQHWLLLSPGRALGFGFSIKPGLGKPGFLVNLCPHFPSINQPLYTLDDVKSVSVTNIESINNEIIQVGRRYWGVKFFICCFLAAQALVGNCLGARRSYVKILIRFCLSCCCSNSSSSS